MAIWNNVKVCHEVLYFGVERITIWDIVLPVLPHGNKLPME
jgi:hypothetical protein